MSLATNDIRYIAHCSKCHTTIGDWALKLPKEDRLCWECKKPKDVTQLGYKSTSTEAKRST